MNSGNSKYSMVVDLVKTDRDRMQVVNELDFLIASLYVVHPDQMDSIIKTKVSVSLANVIRTLLETQNIQISDLQGIKNVLNGVLKLIKELNIIHATIALDPSEALIDALSEWVRDNIEPGLLLSFSIDRHILGGAILDYRGKYWDFSLNKKVNDVFKTKITSLDSLFRDV